MKFFKQDLSISFEEFAQVLPEEAKILENFQGLEVDFEVFDGLLFLRSPYSNPVRIDATSKLKYHQNYFYKNSIYREPLARAIGLKKGQNRPIVIDATAGFLADTLLMMAMGVKVCAYERHPVAAALITNVIKNQNLNLEFHFESSTNIKNIVDVIYFDPMYSEKNEKTLPKKEMRIFREIVGPDADAVEVASKLKSLTQRLVIKRSIKATPILENPSIVINGKSTSYDVYLN